MRSIFTLAINIDDIDHREFIVGSSADESDLDAAIIVKVVNNVRISDLEESNFCRLAISVGPPLFFSDDRALVWVLVCDPVDPRFAVETDVIVSTIDFLHQSKGDDRFFPVSVVGYSI